MFIIDGAQAEYMLEHALGDSQHHMLKYVMLTMLNHA